MQRKISNTKKVRSGTHVQSGQKKLHSIPIINKVKSNVLYSIPCGCVFTLLLVGFFNLTIRNHCFGYDMTVGSPAEDMSTITPIAGTQAPTTASLSLSNPNMINPAIAPGDTAVVDTNVTISVDNAESYNLILSVDNTVLTNGSTTITAGNPDDNTKTNVWGYKWDNASTYTAPTTTGTTLTSSSNPTSGTELSDGNASFTKTLTFAAKFAGDASSGTYHAEGTISLAATPKAATLITLADLTQMQQLAEDYAPDACKNTVIPSGQDYAGPYTLTDVRDNNTYTVYKFKDGKCWMTENLKIHNIVEEENRSIVYTGRTLNPTTSDISTEWTLPSSSTSGFSSDTTSNAYVSGSTGYYTWCAATAGTCSSATSQGSNALSSICPKGWKLPTGGTTGNTDFYNLFKKMGVSISESLNNSGTTDWNNNDFSKAKNIPYNFVYTGFMYVDSTDGLSRDEGSWWSRTASGNASAYSLYIEKTRIAPGTNTYGYNRRYGFAVRCIATESKTFALTYDKNSAADVVKMPASQSCTTTSDTCSITLPSQLPERSGYVFMGWDTAQKADSCSNTAQYNKTGAEITLNNDTILYAIWAQIGCFDV